MKYGFDQDESSNKSRHSINQSQFGLPRHSTPQPLQRSGCKVVLAALAIFIVGSVLAAIAAFKQNGDPNQNRGQGNQRANPLWRNDSRTYPLREVPAGFQTRSNELTPGDFESVKRFLQKVLVERGADETIDPVFDREMAMQQIFKSIYYSGDVQTRSVNGIFDSAQNSLRRQDKFQIVAIDTITENPKQIEVCCHAAQEGDSYLEICYWLVEIPDGSWKIYDWTELDEGIRYSDEVAMAATAVPMQEVNRYRRYQTEFSLGIDAFGSGDHEAALNHWKNSERYVLDGQMSDQQWINISWQYLSLGETQLTLAALSRIKNRNALAIRYVGALAYQYEDDFRNAVPLAQDYLTRVGPAPAMLEIVATSFEAMDNNKQAMEQYQKICRLVPEDPGALYDLVSRTPPNQVNDLKPYIASALESRDEESVSVLLQNVLGWFFGTATYNGRTLIASMEKCPTALRTYIEGAKAEDTHDWERAIKYFAQAEEQAKGENPTRNASEALLRACSIRGEFNRFYELAAHKRLAVESLGSKYLSRTNLSAVDLESLIERHIKTYPDDDYAKYFHAISIGDQGKFQAGIDLLNKIEPDAENQYLNESIQQSKILFFARLGNYQQVFATSETPFARLNTSAKSAWQRREATELRAIIESAEFAKEDDQQLLMAHAYLNIVEGEFAKAIAIFQSLLARDEELDSDLRADINETWTQVLYYNQKNDSLPRPDLSLEDTEILVNKYSWALQYKRIRHLSSIVDSETSKVEEFKKQLLMAAMADNDYEQVISIADSILDDTENEYSNESKHESEIQKVLAKFAIGEEETAIDSLPNFSREVKLLDIPSNDQDKDKLTLRFLLEALRSKSTSDSESPELDSTSSQELSQVIRLMPAQRYDVERWAQSLQLNSSQIALLNGSLPLPIDSYANFNRIQILYQKAPESPEEWFTQFLGESLDTANIEPLSPGQETSSVNDCLSYICKIGEQNLMISFRDWQLKTNSIAKHSMHQETVKKIGAHVLISVFDGNYESELFLDEDPWILESIANLGKTSHPPVAVYLDRLSALIEIESTTKIADLKVDLNDPKVYLADFQSNNWVPKESRNNSYEKLVVEHFQQDGKQLPIRVQARIKKNGIEERFWVKDLKFVPDVDGDFLLEGTPETTPKLLQHVSPLARVTIRSSDVTDWVEQ